MQKSYRDHSAFFNSQEHLQSVVNGLDHRNNYMIEGLDNNVEDLTGIIPPADAIANVDVSTTNYDPELGRAGGAVTNVVLKSGTNGYHGSAFEYNRVNALQARDPFSTPARHIRSTISLAAPSAVASSRDKLFFFGDYQGSRDIAGTNEPRDYPDHGLPQRRFERISQHHLRSQAPAPRPVPAASPSREPDPAKPHQPDCGQAPQLPARADQAGALQ